MGLRHRWLLQTCTRFPIAVLTFLSPWVIHLLSLSLQSTGETGSGGLTSSWSRPLVIFLLRAEAAPLLPLHLPAASTAELRR